MTTGDAYEELDEEAVERRCAFCGHSDREHVVADVGEGTAEWTRRATRCLICEDWHEFVAPALEE
jgi:hypothetical protein